MCIRVEMLSVCIKSGAKSASGYGHLGKTTQGVIFMGHCTFTVTQVSGWLGLDELFTAFVYCFIIVLLLYDNLILSS